MGREKAARKAHGALKTQSFTGPGRARRWGSLLNPNSICPGDEQKLADKGHILDEKGDAWWRRIGYADSQGGVPEVLDSFKAGVPRGPVAAARRYYL